MDRPLKNILLTGPPGCGKTTVIRRAVEQLGDLRMAGFYTQEVRKQGQRVGFEAVGLSGGTSMLARVGFPSEHRVGRYGVDLSGFERIIRNEFGKPSDEVDIYLIDEVGKMECLSPVFVEAVNRVLDGPVPVLASLAAKGGGFIAQVKARQDVAILAVSTSNREGLPEELALRLRSE
jgi:nucleoside-triphosphatase